jgi:hypothetical protein
MDIGLLVQWEAYFRVEELRAESAGQIAGVQIRVWIDEVWQK